MRSRLYRTSPRNPPLHPLRPPTHGTAPGHPLRRARPPPSRAPATAASAASPRWHSAPARSPSSAAWDRARPSPESSRQRRSASGLEPRASRALPARGPGRSESSAGRLSRWRPIGRRRARRARRRGRARSRGSGASPRRSAPCRAARSSRWRRCCRARCRQAESRAVSPVARPVPPPAPCPRTKQSRHRAAPGVPRAFRPARAARRSRPTGFARSPGRRTRSAFAGYRPADAPRRAGPCRQSARRKRARWRSRTPAGWRGTPARRGAVRPDRLGRRPARGGERAQAGAETDACVRMCSRRF